MLVREHKDEGGFPIEECDCNALPD
jgi:hypothetical protein